jgi:5,10-methylene-tetrahydrofolate dehydrogenase/methenyl tetrahydrofolate cyclohydrolase
MIEMLVYGKQLREEMKEGIKQQAAQLPIKLAIVKIGDDKASQAYVNSLVNFGQEVGIPVVTVCLEKHITQAEAEQAIR